MPEKLALEGGPQAVTRTQELRAAGRWPVYSDEEKAAVLAVLEAEDLYGEGARFEAEFAAYHGARYALAHCNGSAALHAAYFAAGVGPGDEVIAPAYTWHLQVSQVLALHALPVFADIEPKAATLDPVDVRRKITPRTKAIAVLHPFGAPAELEEIVAIGREQGIPVIEDCSHAHGATYHGRKVGTFGDIGCFSLQASKLMNSIEGGILITDNERYYERACVLGHYDRIPKLTSESYRRFHDPSVLQAPTCFGFKYRIHPLAAAIARVQLRHLDERNALRRRTMGYLTQHLAEVGRGVLVPPYEAPDTERLWLNYLCTYSEERSRGIPRAKFIEALQAEGLPATGGRAGYLPVYWNPLYTERVSMWAEGDPFDLPGVEQRRPYAPGLCPEAERFWQRTVALPVLHHPVSDALLDEIVHAVEKVVCGLTGGG
jgi:dTDP-4-amino-4,6-dideoxygalactose transaminase